MSRQNFGLKQKFNVKFFADIVTFIITCVLFMIFAKIKGIAPYDTFIFLFIIISFNAVIFVITRYWTLRTLKNSFSSHSNALAQTAEELNETIINQNKAFDNLNINSKNISELMIKLQNLSETLTATSKNTEKQISQSISFSQKEHDAIAVSSDKMLVLRQKIQMIAELILELSEHTQQIGNSISVVDDIAEQTNMLALNAAVEAARAGEHGKGFAVVAGEIRKLADESKQAITKITSLTNSIQYTTNSTVMATEEGSKEIESVVKDINILFSDSENLLNIVKDSLESINNINSDAKKYSELMEKIRDFDEQNSKIAADLQKNIKDNSDKVFQLNSLSEDIKSSANEG